MTYTETLDIIYKMMPDFQNVGADAYKPGLERVTRFNTLLGNPDHAFRAIHIAGTNGKGSVSHMIASVLQQDGYRVGLYTSPHLRDFRERIKIDGQMISEEEVVDFAHKHLETMRALGLSFFEATMCMAFDHFAHKGVDIAVIETGMGGRLDSTNIITPLVSVITNIGMDHQRFLGDTPAKIAREKAGIIKQGVPVVIGERGADTDMVFTDKATEMGAEIVFAQDLFQSEKISSGDNTQTFRIINSTKGESRNLTLDLLGSYQARNIVTVMGAVSVLNKVLEKPIDENALEIGLASASASTGLHGRWEVIGRNPLIVYDTGHNSHGLRLVAEQIRNERYDRLYMVIGMVSDKDFDQVLPLLPRDAHYIFTSPSIGRALPAAELATKASAYGLTGEIVPVVSDALVRACQLASPTDMIFVGGSTFTVAEVIGNT